MESICEKCKNYVRHYFFKNGRFFYMYSGYCDNKHGKFSQRKRVCKLFESDQHLSYKNSQLNLLCGIFRLEKQVNLVFEAFKNLKTQIIKFNQNNNNNNLQ